MNAALRARWYWLARCKEDRPWKDLKINVHKLSKELFCTRTRFGLRNDMKITIWQDAWINGGAVSHIAPDFLPFMCPKALSDTVVLALEEGKWVSDIRAQSYVKNSAMFS